MDLDALFSEGTELGDDVIVKAQLRFRVRPPQHPVAQDIVDRVVAAYDERLDMICSEVEEVLQHADLRRSTSSVPLVLYTPGMAKSAVYQPGAKGGKWYRDGKGNIRYGEQPSQQFKSPAGGAVTGQQLGHYRPSKFMGMGGMDRDLTGFLMGQPGKYGFSKNELRFLGSWFGTDTQSGALFEAFLDVTGLTRDDLSGDLAQLRFGPQELTYEEAVFEFFAAQRELFMGDESEYEDADAEWDHVLNDEIRPLLDSVLTKYEALKTDGKFAESYSKDGDRQRRKFFDSARKHAASMSKLASQIVSAWNPARQVDDVVAAMKKLGLFVAPSKTATHAHVHDRPHLKGSLTLDDRLLVDDPKSNPLLASGDKLTKLPVSQLMLVYVAAELHRRWDPETKSYSSEKQAEIGAGSLGTAALDAVADKSSQWKASAPLARKHLDVLVDRVVAAVNKDVPTDQPSQKKPRPKAKK